MTRHINAIVAVCDDWGIGQGGGLLVRNKADMRTFVEHTMGGTVVMGRRTLESLPGERPLKGRRNVVLTRDEDFSPEGIEVCHGVREVLELTAADDAVWIIGGESVYRSFLPHCEHVYVTRNQCTLPADAFFPDLDRLPGWQLVSTSDGGTTEDGTPYSFATYEHVV
ncbi:MAG: dihydrofolate reductase [Atopobiaceae bacterium]|jgi:dihydrofolate reductase|nr:dihydrofolate reductase [Atopobiaceae bacterium]MCI2172906.1 dihydrofolate reductase [Atopobiaceae bacterium]MCI2208311.1 dihydrofolate reductase [Atopobiaceae bacterium]